PVGRKSHKRRTAGNKRGVDAESLGGAVSLMLQGVQSPFLFVRDTGAARLQNGRQLVGGKQTRTLDCVAQRVDLCFREMTWNVRFKSCGMHLGHGAGQGDHSFRTENEIRWPIAGGGFLLAPMP